MIEEEIFQRCKIDKKKLEAYGFQCKNNQYRYSRNIMQNTLRVDVIITTDSKIRVNIIDLMFNEEYVIYRVISQTGEYVAKVRTELKHLLYDIKNKCMINQYYASNQANRISKLIKQKYYDEPEFMWETSPNYGVYRNAINQKWYALIMNVNIAKLAQGDYEVDIINVKLNPDKISQLLHRQGFYKAYHMNKKYWISILLDETLCDEEIMSYIEESRAFTEKKM